MIIDQLREDIEGAISFYVRNYANKKGLSPERKIDIEIIRRFLEEDDPIVICKDLETYLNSMSLFLVSWIPFIDRNAFINCVKTVLKKEQYAMVNLLQAIVKEQRKLLEEYRNTNPFTVNYSKKEQQLEAEIKLLKNENSFLYETLEKLEKRVCTLEQENKTVLHRAQQAEDQLKMQKNSHTSSDEIPSIATPTI